MERRWGLLTRPQHGGRGHQSRPKLPRMNSKPRGHTHRLQVSGGAWDTHCGLAGILILGASWVSLELCGYAHSIVHRGSLWRLQQWVDLTRALRGIMSILQLNHIGGPWQKSIKSIKLQTMCLEIRMAPPPYLFVRPSQRQPCLKI